MTRMRIPYPPVKPPATSREQAGPRRPTWDQAPDRAAQDAENTPMPAPLPQRLPFPRDRLWFTKFRKRWDDPLPADLADATDAGPAVESAAHDAAPASAATLRQDAEPSRDSPPDRSADADDTQRPSPPPQRLPIPHDRLWFTKFRKRWDAPMPAGLADATGAAPAEEPAAHHAAATLRHDTEPGRTSWDHPPDRSADAEDTQKPSPHPQRSPIPGGDRWWLMKIRKHWNDPMPDEPSSAGEPAGPARSGTAVQLRAAPGGAATLTASEVHTTAAAGIRDSGEPLPYGDRIQRAFGPDHDLSQVTAHVGGAATAAAAQLQASAYTAGEHIAFASAPDLRLAAHEAAHVVQQRTGVALSGGVGRSGDSYEQNADAVAERVAAGGLATDLLPLAAATRGHAPAVQFDEQRDAPPAHDDASSDTDVDIEWVANLDQKLLDEIDVYYSDAKARNASAAATREQLRAVRATSPADAAWQKHQIAIAGERRKDEAAADLDQAMKSHHRAETAVDPSGPVITRGEGRRIARRNFVKWTAALFGSVDKAKEHYQSIKPVPGLGILLTKKAGERLLAARKEFEAAHPGFTFVPGGGFSMRDLHEARKGVGMLGHALGVAIDIHSTQNPNIRLRGETKPPTYEYLIARTGADARGRPGRARMSLDDTGFGSADRTIEALGKATLAGRDTRHDPIVEKIRTQFAEMVATSERLQRSMANSLPLLRETRTLYFQWLKDKAQLAVHELRKDLTDVALISLRSKVNAEERTFDKNLKQALQPWFELIEKHAALDRAALAFENALLEGQDRKLREIDAVAAKDPDALDKLSALDARWQLSELSHAPKPTHPAALKAFLQKRAREQRAAIPSGPNATGSREYLTAELAVLNHWRDLLSDPSLVFGAPNRPLAAEDIPVMQLIEHGFIESSPMMGPVQLPKKEDVFNAEVAAVLARHGFAPGATFGDTMHFDFIEGYSLAVPGGRSSNNMNPDRFGPLGPHGPSTPDKDKR